ncbi:MAG: hypothetical protein JW784_00100 [Candidatus Cloacimonetes bacterium]|nr:hypothetical protein [Candidatus Cloacimonadota bacterium]
MQICDLVPIGRLGRKADKEGFIDFHADAGFKNNLIDISEIFLIFKNNRVKFVTLLAVDNARQPRIKLAEMDVTAEAARENNVVVLLTRQQLKELTGDNTEVAEMGMIAWFNNEPVGELIDIFDNGAHEVLVIARKEGKEILVPNVEYFVAGVRENNILLQNIEELLDL